MPPTTSLKSSCLSGPSAGLINTNYHVWQNSIFRLFHFLTSFFLLLLFLFLLLLLLHLFILLLFCFSPQNSGHLPISCGRMGELFVSHRKRRSLYQKEKCQPGPTTDLHENEASYLFSLNKCRNFAQTHIANTRRMHNEARFSPSKTQAPGKKCQDCKTMFRIKTDNGIDFFLHHWLAVTSGKTVNLHASVSVSLKWVKILSALEGNCEYL